jgi:protein-L-isoaspartate(D-aspartate) O-methyltransferase
MASLLDLHGEGKVLEIGTGSGYQAAVLSMLAETVISLECIPSLAEIAGQNLEKCLIKNVKIVCQDGSDGYLCEAPYNGIVVAACAPKVPAELFEQLAHGGTLVIPVGDRSIQVLQVWKKSSTGNLSFTEHIPVVFVPLRGKRGFKD